MYQPGDGVVIRHAALGPQPLCNVLPLVTHAKLLSTFACSEICADARASGEGMQPSQLSLRTHAEEEAMKDGCTAPQTGLRRCERGSHPAEPTFAARANPAALMRP